METRSTVSYRLVTLMDANGTKGVELANYLDMSKKASRSIDVETLSRICDYYGITMDEFFGKGALSPEESRLVSLYRGANAQGRKFPRFRA